MAETFCNVTRESAIPGMCNRTTRFQCVGSLRICWRTAYLWPKMVFLIYLAGDFYHQRPVITQGSGSVQRD